MEIYETQAEIGKRKSWLLSLVVIVLVGFVYALGSVDFPAPNKKIEKILPNENFKIVK